jgi:hypothetical protein
MTFGFDERRRASAIAFLQWEKKRIPFKIEVPNINQLYVEKMREDLLSWPGFHYQKAVRPASPSVLRFSGTTFSRTALRLGFFYAVAR